MSVGNVIILRGVSGSGKSTYAKKLVEDGAATKIISADDYFTDRDGNYSFDPKKLKEAHGKCLRDYLWDFGEHYANERHFIVVDNTNTQLWELAPYVAIAEAYGVSFEIIHVVCPTQVAVERNVHGVPLQTVMKQAQRFEDPLPWWPSRTVSGIPEK